MSVYKVEVHAASHADLRIGVLVSRRSFVTVAAATDTEAVLVATQMAAAVSGKMPTDALLLNFPT